VRLLIAVIALSLLASCGACRRNRLPAKDSPQYREYVKTFFIGLAALQAGDDQRAKDSLSRATTIVPDEPAAWINLAILELKQKLYDPSAEHLEKARTLAPELGSIYFLQGTLESARGNYDTAVKNYRRAIELDQNDLRARYSLAQELERQGGPTADGDAFTLYQQVLAKAPNNTAAILEVARLAAKRGDAAALTEAVNRLRTQSAAWPPEVKDQFTALETAAANPAAATTQVAFLRNVMLRLPAFRQDSLALKLPPEIVAEPISRFVKLALPDSAAAAPDIGLKYSWVSFEPSPSAIWAVAMQLTPDGPPKLVWQDNYSGLYFDQPNTANPTKLPLPPTKLDDVPAGIATIDLNYDFRLDIVAANTGGIRFFGQQATGEFRDVTAATKLSPQIVNAAYAGIWPADIDLDGDLDLVVAPIEGSPVTFQNNGDSTFAVDPVFAGATNVRGFAYGDLDADGDPDAVTIDTAGRVAVFTDERGGTFHPITGPSGIPTTIAITIADINGDGRLDLLTGGADGVIRRASLGSYSLVWDLAEIAHGDGVTVNKNPLPGLIVADLDNNGTNDLIFGADQRPRIYLGDGTQLLKPLPTISLGSVISVADFDGDGLLDEVGLEQDQPIVALAKGTKNYHWQDVHPRAANATGDQRINSFGVGGEMELRAGLLYQKQIINGPVVHFGLGDQPAADVIRVVWPNGSVQAEFDMKPDQAILTEQRLKGSCPHLFAWDGKEMRFIKDAPPWSPALGLKINAQTTAGVGQTEEWFTLPGDAVAPAADGMYDLRITAELWETFYIDRYSLLVVDHIPAVAIFTDERFSIPAPKLEVVKTQQPRPFARVTDDNGQEVSAPVAALDEKYLDTFGRGQYQGVTRDHYVECELPDIAPSNGSFYLLAQGWLHPTDASINVALSQGKSEPPHGLSIEIPDGHGGWRVVRDKLGFPAGKFKNVLLDLSDLIPAGQHRVFRLRTNMEIYWDRLSWTSYAAEPDLLTHRIELSAAELTHRGFSVMTKADAGSPEVPHYDQIETTGQKWRDLEGYYTRFGDILELLKGVDGRFVLVNAGDEIRLRFPAPPPPPNGYVRDFVLIGNGWIKDGDLNSGFSRTVLPLPTLDMTEYTRPPGRLDDEPAYRAHPDDWRNYHTRYVAPDQFRNAMRLFEK
jgi:Tfp pilus assembly protein PilF